MPRKQNTVGIFECKSKIKWFSTNTISCQILYIMLFRILSINNPWDILSCDPSLAQHVLPMHCSFNHNRVTFQDYASSTILIYPAPLFHSHLIFAHSAQVRWGGARVQDRPIVSQVLVCMYLVWVSEPRWEDFSLFGWWVENFTYVYLTFQFGCFLTSFSNFYGFFEPKRAKNAQFWPIYA